MVLGLADLPGMVWDSLNNLRNSAAWQERQWRELQQLQYRLGVERRRDWLAFTGFALGFSGVVYSSGLSAFLCLTTMILVVLWRVLA
jgi:ubiquinone biosynthesis protein